MRGGPLKPRQLLYEAGSVELDLLIEPSDRAGRKTVVGQIMHPMASQKPTLPILVTLKAQDGTSRSETANHLGEFVFHDVKEGRYSLDVQMSGMEITVEEAYF